MLAAAVANARPHLFACPAAQVERLLRGVLERGHELSEEEIIVLFAGAWGQWGGLAC
jgi:hypothetical protein